MLESEPNEDEIKNAMMYTFAKAVYEIPASFAKGVVAFHTIPSAFNLDIELPNSKRELSCTPSFRNLYSAFLGAGGALAAYGMAAEYIHPSVLLVPALTNIYSGLSVWRKNTIEEIKRKRAHEELKDIIAHFKSKKSGLKKTSADLDEKVLNS